MDGACPFLPLGDLHPHQYKSSAGFSFYLWGTAIFSYSGERV